MSTFMAKTIETHRNRRWFVIDATGQSVGRLAVQAATILRGKHTPIYTPHIDTGDFVIITNADKVVFTGRKMDQKVYQSYSGYAGGQKSILARDMMARKPEFVIGEAIRRMVPRNRMGRQQMTKLKVYTSAWSAKNGNRPHPHQAQEPIELNPSAAVFAGQFLTPTTAKG